MEQKLSYRDIQNIVNDKLIWGSIDNKLGKFAKYAPILNGYEYRKAPKDVEWHFIINEVKYVEDMISNFELAYDNDFVATINLLARYYRNYKGGITNYENIRMHRHKYF